MTTILDLLAADPNVDPALRAVMTPQWFRPQCGRWGRVFLSQADADAYDRGWSNYPGTPSFESASGPEWIGCNDREADQQARDEMRADEATEREQE
jgi:hypothetical protein